MSTHWTLHHCPRPQLPPSPAAPAARSGPGLAVTKAAEDHADPSVGFVSHGPFPAGRESRRSFTLLAEQPAELCTALLQ